MNTLNNLEILITKWADDRKILSNGTIAGQSAKLGEELGELFQGLLSNDKPLVIDSIGDVIVVLNNIAVMSGTTLTECLNQAYSDIKDRKGYLNEAGIFVKETK